VPRWKSSARRAPFRGCPAREPGPVRRRPRSSRAKGSYRWLPGRWAGWHGAVRPGRFARRQAREARARAASGLVITWSRRSPVGGGERPLPGGLGSELDRRLDGKAAGLAHVFGLSTMPYPAGNHRALVSEETDERGYLPGRPRRARQHRSRARAARQEHRQRNWLRDMPPPPASSSAAPPRHRNPLVPVTRAAVCHLRTETADMGDMRAACPLKS